MELKLEDEHKLVIKKSLTVLNEFGKVNFKPYLNALTEMVDMPITNKTNVEFLVLNAQNKLLDEFNGSDLELTKPMIETLSAYKKVLNDDFNFSDEELSAVSLATENFARLGMAQTGYARDLMMMAFPKIDTKSFCDIAQNFDIAERHIGATNGIRAERTSEDSRVAWDIHQVARNYLSWKRNPEGAMTTHYDTPMKTSKCPLMKIEGYEPKSEVERSAILEKNRKSRGRKPF